MVYLIDQSSCNHFLKLNRTQNGVRSSACFMLRCVLRACLKNTRGSATRDFGRSRGGEARESPQRALRAEPTKAGAKRTAARRVFAQKALWLRCASVTAPLRGCSLVASRYRAFCAKTEPLVFFRHALRAIGRPAPQIASRLC
jgi:hypothetical protein